MCPLTSDLLPGVHKSCVKFPPHSEEWHLLIKNNMRDLLLWRLTYKFFGWGGVEVLFLFSRWVRKGGRYNWDVKFRFSHNDNTSWDVNPFPTGPLHSLTSDSGTNYRIMKNWKLQLSTGAVGKIWCLLIREEGGVCQMLIFADKRGGGGIQKGQK